MDVEISKDDLLTMLQATGKSQFTLKEFRQFVLDKWSSIKQIKVIFVCVILTYK